jgi:hypothetical protein
MSSEVVTNDSKTTSTDKFLEDKGTKDYLWAITDNKKYAQNFPSNNVLTIIC